MKYLALAITLMPSLVLAQPMQLFLTNDQPPRHAQTGDADLDRAMAICDAHWHPNNTVIDTSPPQQGGDYERPYGTACLVIERSWGTTATAKAAREYAEKQAADKVWLDHYVQTKETSK